MCTDGVAPQMKTVDGLYITLTDLLSHTAYRLRVEAATRMGSGPSSQPITCLTDESGTNLQVHFQTNLRQLPCRAQLVCNN